MDRRASHKARPWSLRIHMFWFPSPLSHAEREGEKTCENPREQRTTLHLTWESAVFENGLGIVSAKPLSRLLLFFRAYSLTVSQPLAIAHSALNDILGLLGTDKCHRSPKRRGHPKGDNPRWAYWICSEKQITSASRTRRGTIVLSVVSWNTQDVTETYWTLPHRFFCEDRAGHTIFDLWERCVSGVHSGDAVAETSYTTRYSCQKLNIQDSLTRNFILCVQFQLV